MKDIEYENNNENISINNNLKILCIGESIDIDLVNSVVEICNNSYSDNRISNTIDNIIKSYIERDYKGGSLNAIQ